MHDLALRVYAGIGAAGAGDGDGLVGHRGEGACERGLHAYEIVERALTLRVVQSSLEQGLVTLPHHWNGAAPLAAGEAA